MATTSASPAPAAAVPASASASSSSSSTVGAAPTASTDPVQEQLRQLNDARKLVLGNVSFYPTIVQGILPILGPASLPQLRRWGADFLAEAFSAPALPSRDKETLSLLVLESLKGMIENPNEDVFVLRSIIQAAASIYPLVMRWVINNSYDTPTWERMLAIKARILRLWEAPMPSIQICCVKFAQRVVLAQTHAASPEGHRDGLDISLHLIPPGHPLLDPRHLEAEATGLLDRMLGVLQDNGKDALIVDATLNTLSILVRTRPSTVSRTINALLNYNPLKQATQPMTPRMRVMLKSMEKTTRMLLIHLTKRDPQNTQNPRIHQHIERLMRSRAELLDDAGRKRVLADQQAAANGGGDAKRQRISNNAVGAGAQSVPNSASAATVEIPPLAPGPHSLADFFALTANPQLRSFRVANVPLDLVARISVSTLARVDATLLSRALQGIHDRLATATAAAVPGSTAAADVPLDGPAYDDDDDDYEPDFFATEDTEQILNKLDMDSAGGGPPGSGGADGGPSDKATVLGKADAAASAVAAASLALGAFALPKAPALTATQAVTVGKASVARVFDAMHAAEEGSAAVVPAATVARRGGTGVHGKDGLARVAASAGDREAWTTILTRLATRSISGLEGSDDDGDEKMGPGENDSSDTKAVARPVLNDSIRELLFRYVLEDFRRRIDVAVAWLCEEWYNDQLSQRYGGADAGETDAPSTPARPRQPRHYEEWAVRVLDGFVTYLHGQDNKVLTRFLSEIPALSAPLLERVKSLCRDPLTVPLALNSLLYQLIMRPPARALTLDTMQEIWVEFEDARPMATKYLDKWRPGFVEARRAELAAAAEAAP